MSLKDTCANTYFLDKHLAEQEAKEEMQIIVYEEIKTMFKDEMATVEFKEDIYEDLRFETKYLIEEYNAEIDCEEIMQEVFDYYEIRGA